MIAVSSCPVGRAVVSSIQPTSMRPAAPLEEGANDAHDEARDEENQCDEQQPGHRMQNVAPEAAEGPRRLSKRPSPQGRV